MNDPDLLLAELFAADEAPAVDSAFVLRVIERVEQRRLRLDLVGLMLSATAASAVLWALSPLMETLAPRLLRLAADPGAISFAGAAILAAWLWAWVSGRAGLAHA